MPGFFLALLAIYAGILGVQANLEDVPTTEQLYESLIGGTETDRSLYPEMIYLQNERGSRCSGVIVGPRVILTAAHCTTQGGKIRNYFRGGGFVEFEARCNLSKPWTDGRIDYDFALCKSTVPIVGAKPATMARRMLKKGDKITMAGFGCTNANASGGNNGILKTGPSVVGIPARNNYNYIYAFNEPVLCFGDSGGPFYQLLTDPIKQRHIVFGVNSRTNLVSLSALTATSTKPIQSYIKTWAKNQKVGICGINMKCKIAGLSSHETNSNVTIEEILEEVNDEELDDDGL